MSSPLPADKSAEPHHEDEDAPGSEEEGDVVMQAPESDDSSEEPEDNEEEVRKVQEGFIVDEEEEEEEEDDEEEERRRRRRRKHKRRRREISEDLEDDDLDLVEENTGTRIRPRQKLTRLRRGRASSSPPPEISKPRRSVALQDDDLDVRDIWDDDRGRGRDGDEDVEMEDEEEDFIVEDEYDDEGGEMGEAERQARRKAEKERRKALGSRPELAGIDQNAWDEIYDVFGHGDEYDWALDADEPQDYEVKPETRYQDIFEPSEIKARLLTEDDDIIRAQDIPERMQLVTSSLSTSTSLSVIPRFERADLESAAEWVAHRISPDIIDQFFRPTGAKRHLLSQFLFAVSTTLENLLCHTFEVPYIYTHKRDFITHFEADGRRTDLLSRDELWTIYSLGQRFRALLERKRAVEQNYLKMGVNDSYFEDEVRPKMDTIEVVADVTEWMGMKYKHSRRDRDTRMIDGENEDDAEHRKRKMPSRLSGYDVAKKTIVSRLADDFGLAPHEIVLNFLTKDRKRHFIEDQDLSPFAYAEQFVDPNKAESSEDVLKIARMIIATELGKDPLLRREIRELFRNHSRVSVHPTEKGLHKIDENHPYYNFKYLKDKPVKELLDVPQFLHILAAESDHLVTVSIELDGDQQHRFQATLTDAFASGGFSDTAKTWNEQRAEVVKEAVEKYLIPVGVKWVREWIREEAEEHLAKRCGNILEARIDVRPYTAPDYPDADCAAVLAVSWGEGDPKKDAIHAVFLDEAGRMRENIRLDNLVDPEARTEFSDLVNRRRPDVIVAGGFAANTHRLVERIKELVGDKNGATDREQDRENREKATSSNTGGWGSLTQNAGGNDWGSGNAGGGWGNNASSGSGWGESASKGSGWDDSGNKDRQGDTHREKERSGESATRVIYVHDEVARLYQHSKRAEEEYGSLPVIARYCVGLARYVQSPLNEYAALGSDIAAITFDENQQLIPKEKLLTALERALVNVVNDVGVDINRAVHDAYYQHLLPFVSGLGPRKAQVVIKKISALGGTLINREQFVKSGIMTSQIFLNAVAFLRIAQDPDHKDSSKNRNPDTDVPDPLDSTRIHPEDYELARKMATDAMEVDEEDMEGEHPSQTVMSFMKVKDGKARLDGLNLDDFAANLLQTQSERKRHTLNMIKAELLRPYADRRPDFVLPDDWEVLTMLTGETRKSLRVGLIVSVQVLRTKPNFVMTRLSSNIEGIINAKYLADGDQAVNPDDVCKQGQTMMGVIIDVTVDKFLVELSARPADVAGGDAHIRKIQPDAHYDHVQAHRDKDLLHRKQQAKVRKTRRNVKHPNFHDFNSKQAEEYLSKQQRGDVVIRPSSKGSDHLAVTWKVDDGVYQHIDVVEPNADLERQTVGTQLIIDGQWQYSDLDELIVTHVQAMARKVDELMAHEKYKGGSEQELHTFLKNYVAANPTKSIYAFGLNRQKPGYFNLSFLANKSSPIQTWPVKVTPHAYSLFGEALPSVPQLCDAFKLRHLGSRIPNANPTGKTPYGAGIATPGGARTPGRATPGHMSTRRPLQPGTTPNPYQTQPPGPPPMGPPVSAYQSSRQPPYPPYPAQGPSSWGQPPPPPPGQRHPGMDPGRAAMLAQQNAGGGWGSGGGGGGGSRW